MRIYKHKRATINDVAKLAKVGKASVSRYLNGKFDILSDSIKSRIKHAIDELDYQPSFMAQGIKKGNSRLIALILADITNPYSIEIMRGVEYSCRKNGYTLLVFNTDNNTNMEEEILSILISYHVEGAIINTTKSDCSYFINYPFPLVFLDRKIDELKSDIVGLNNIEATEIILSHLVENNFNDFIFVTESIGTITSRKLRTKTFIEKINQNKNISGRVLEINNDDHLDELLREFILSSPSLSKAIITANGAVTLKTAQSLRNLGIEWGKDIGLIGFDDPSWTRVAGVGISCLKQPTFEIGKKAFDLLHTRLNNPIIENQEVYYSGELIIRKSTTFLK